jgi:hypothetical protein
LKWQGQPGLHPQGPRIMTQTGVAALSKIAGSDSV